MERVRAELKRERERNQELEREREMEREREHESVFEREHSRMVDEGKGRDVDDDEAGEKGEQREKVNGVDHAPPAKEVADADKWCALCEGDGHDSISCPFEK